jgi:O-antigen/teichoic acid export membrane protein
MSERSERTRQHSTFGRTRERTVVGGSMVLVVGRYLNAVLGYIGTAIIARTLSPDDWGAISLIFAVFALLGPLSDVQASRLVVAEILDEPERAGEVIGAYMVLRLLLGIVAGTAGVVYLAATNDSASILKASLLAGSVFLLAPMWNALALFFQTRQWLRSMGVAMVGAQLVQLALTIAIARSGRGTLVTFVLPFVAFDALVLLALVAIAGRHIKIRPTLAVAKWRRWLREAVPIAIGAALGTVYFRLDMVMLSRLDTLDSVGLYSVAYRFSDLIGYVPNALMAAAFPLLVAAWPSNTESLHRTFRGSLILLMVAALGAVALFTPFAGSAIRLLYGARFAPAAGAARLLVIGQVLHFVTTLEVTLLIACGRHRLYPVATLLGVVLAVVLNIALIPGYSYVGSGWATVLTEIAVAAALVVGVRRVLGGWEWPSRAMAVAGLAGVATFAVGALLQLVVPWPVAFIAGVLTFLGVLQFVGIEPEGGVRSLTLLLRGRDLTDEPMHLAEI